MDRVVQNVDWIRHGNLTITLRQKSVLKMDAPDSIQMIDMTNLEPTGIHYFAL